MLELRPQSALKLAVSRGKDRRLRHEAPKFPLESVQRRVRVSGRRWFQTGPTTVPSADFCLFLLTGWRQPRQGATHRSPMSLQPKLGTFDQKKARPTSTTAAAPGHLNPPDTARPCWAAPARGENKDEVLTIKTLAALSSCVITSGAPTAAIIVPLQ